MPSGGSPAPTVPRHNFHKGSRDSVTTRYIYNWVKVSTTVCVGNLRGLLEFSWEYLIATCFDYDRAPQGLFKVLCLCWFSRRTRLKVEARNLEHHDLDADKVKYTESYHYSSWIHGPTILSSLCVQNSKKGLHSMVFGPKRINIWVLRAAKFRIQADSTLVHGSPHPNL